MILLIPFNSSNSFLTGEKTHSINSIPRGEVIYRKDPVKPFLLSSWTAHRLGNSTSRSSLDINAFINSEVNSYASCSLWPHFIWWYWSHFWPVMTRYWAGLEKSWNGYLLTTVSVVLNRAANFVWKKVRTVVRLLETTYEKGVKIGGKDMQAIEERLERSDKLPLYDITIAPLMV